jgi:hypothetical protein
MNEYTKKLMNHFLIGVFAVIPIVIVLQIILFVKGLISELFQIVYGFSDNYLYTALLFAVSFILLVSIGNTIVKKGRSWVISAFDFVIDRIPFLNTIYRVLKKVINMFSSHEQTMAKEVVYVEYPKEGVWVPAYVTNKHENKYVLFVPTSILKKPPALLSALELITTKLQKRINYPDKGLIRNHQTINITLLPGDKLQCAQLLFSIPKPGVRVDECLLV